MSDDVQLEPDVLVRTALQLLPVPDHGDGFWQRVDERLSAEPVPAAPAAAPRAATVPVAAATSTEPPEVVELRPAGAQSVLPPGVRRRSNALVALAAVAAAVVVVVASSALVRQRGDDVGTTELAGTVTTAATTTVPGDGPMAATGPAVPEVSEAAGDESAAAVISWLGALGDGDEELAWAALGPASRAHLGDPTGLEELMSGLAEGYGAWAAASPEQVIVTPVATAGEAVIVVVTLVGDVAQEGQVERRADAFPVRLVASPAQRHVEPFDTAGTVEVVEPQPGPPGEPARLVGEELVVVVPAGVAAPVVRLDDGETLVCGASPGTELTELEGSPGQRCAITPAGGIPAGERLLTVAFVAPDASGVSAETIRFKAG